ncbi:MAG TPA: efflux RND transporter periplasmic adaptor subunit [Candidatus Limnocylindrales bacterium]|jgi:RND family efflux transporter MFP subunit
MRLKLLAIVVLLVVGGGALYAAIGGFAPTPTAATSLLTAVATVTDVTDEIAATGSVAAATRYQLWFGTDAVASDGSAADDGSSSQGDPTASSVTWPVTEVKVAAGDHVTKGDVLATADDVDLEARIADANRSAKSAAIQLTIAEENLDGADTTDTRRQARLALYNAQTSDANARADLAALKALRDATTLVAPADGIVTAVAIASGTDAPSGAAITLLSSDVRIVTSVVESDVASIEVGQAATVSVSAIDASLRGTVSSIDPVGSGSGQNGVVAYAVNVALDAPPAALRPGMSADITIVADSASGVLAVPSRALSGSAGNYTVRVVAADGTVSVKPVQVGLVTSSLAEIKAGLQAGEQVVTGSSSAQNQATNGNGGPGAFPGGGTIIRGNP